MFECFNDDEDKEYLNSADEIREDDLISLKPPLGVDPDHSNISEDSDEIASNPAEVDTDDKAENLFLFKGIFFERFYRNQLRPKEIFRHSTQDIVKTLWQGPET